VQAKIQYTSDKLASYQDDDRIINLTRVWDAYSGDVIMEYAFGFCYENLKSEDFVETFHDAFLALTEFGGLGCQYPILGPMMEMMPDWLTRAMNPRLSRVVTMLNVGVLLWIVFDPFTNGKNRISLTKSTP
jgi:hypothetical protein